MKLNFKDLKQQKFTVDAEPSDTIAAVKQKVAAEKGLEAAQMRLIWSGKILQDSNTLDQYEIKPNDQIVCMVQKPKAAPVATKAPSTPAPAAIQTPAAPAPASGLVPVTANPPATPSPAPAAASTRPADRGFNDPSPMVGPERQAAIANLESMGFERPQIERAMRAAFYNADRAVEYLLNGIPESAQQAPPQTAPAAAPQASVPDDSPMTQEADEPVNLFEAAAAANQGGGARGASRGATRGLGGTDAAGGAGLAGAGAGGLDFLRDNPTFQHLRQLVQQNPQMLENVLQQVGASNPQLSELISANPEAFLQLLGEAGDEEGVPLPPGAQSVSVTEEERDAIERLCRLGFERDLVIQAYFACDKNEELAANFLFDHPDEEQD